MGRKIYHFTAGSTQQNNKFLTGWLAEKRGSV
jgi:hypothetical protein